MAGLSKATYVAKGYAQVEPNHLSAQRTGQIYAQLPAKSDIDVLENGQFVKYDYANNMVDFTGDGEWMLVLNEVKLYRDYLGYSDFAMKKTDYAAQVFAPLGGAASVAQARDYSGVVTPADPYEPDATTTPFGVTSYANVPQLYPEGTSAMVPRVLKTNVGDILTTNCLAYGKSGDAALTNGVKFTPDPANYGILTKVGTAADPTSTTSKVIATANATILWQVVKVYTMPDGQPGVKLMRIA